MTGFRILAAAAALAAPAVVAGQQPPPQPQQSAPARLPAPPRAAASTRASVEVLLNGRLVQGQWLTGAAGTAGPARLAIDYGQPHARGRRIFGPTTATDTALVRPEQVWRFGANMATQLTTDVDVTIGDAFIPAGVYTLFLLPSRSGWRLIVSRQYGEWGTDYDPSKDFARISLRSRTLAEPIESLTIWLVPALEPQGSTAMPHGTVRIAWERTELTTDWRMGK